MFEAGQAERFSRGEGLALADTDQLPPMSGFVAKTVQKRWTEMIAARDKLALVTGDRGKFLLPMVADIQNKCRLCRESQVHAVVMEDALRMVRLAREVALGEFRPEPRRFDQLGSRHVVGMSIRSALILAP